MNKKDKTTIYKEFMYNPSNSHNCDGCPENKNSDNWEGKLPCGQQNCWVDCHNKVNEEYKVYTTYAEDSDITFIMEDCIIDDRYVTTEVKGFYYGKPDKESTEYFYGKLSAEYEY